MELTVPNWKTATKRQSLFSSLNAICFLFSTPVYSQVSQELQAKLEKPLVDYRHCVFPRAVEFALNSDEPADAIRQAAVAACFRERDTAVEALKRAGMDDAGIKELDRHVDEQLILAAISTRTKK
jgi:hypothetical protein